MMTFSSLPSPTPMESTLPAANYLYGIFHEDPFLCSACIELAADKVNRLEQKLLTDRTAGARSNTLCDLWEMRKVLNAMLSYAVEVYPHTLSSTMDPAFNRHVKV